MASYAVVPKAVMVMGLEIKDVDCGRRCSHASKHLPSVTRIAAPSALCPPLTFTGWGQLVTVAGLEVESICNGPWCVWLALSLLSVD